MVVVESLLVKEEKSRVREILDEAAHFGGIGGDVIQKIVVFYGVELQPHMQDEYFSSIVEYLYGLYVALRHLAEHVHSSHC